MCVYFSAQLDVAKLYLFLYNLFQFVGYGFIFFTLMSRLLKNSEEAVLTGMEAVGTPVMVCQVVAVLEVIHSMAGLVKTGIISPFMQCAGRNFVLFILILQEPRLHSVPAVTYLFLVWSAVEVIRYPYYMITLVDIKSEFLTWLRYTAWIPLYPLGILLEGTIIIMSIPLFEQTGWYSFTLPNSANMAFYFPWFLHVYLLFSAIGGYFLLNHMYDQRKKKLKGNASTNGSKKNR
ncbi:hypothetical protein ScPMuIL_017919 [Solemya velum]